MKSPTCGALAGGRHPYRTGRMPAYHTGATSVSEYDDDASLSAPTEVETEHLSANETAQQPETEQTETPDEAPKQPTPDARDRAIRQLAFEQRETRRQLAAARAQLERLQPRPDPSAPAAPADVERLIEERAAALVEQRAQAAKSQAWVASGEKEYPDFTERCNALADMGAAENKTFLAAIGELDAGHKVVAELANDPAEATRILALSPVKMALALAKLEDSLARKPAPAPKPVSAAPAPIKPIASTARAEVTPDKMTPEQYQRWWNSKRG